MTRIIMNGCNGKMGQVISSLVAEDEGAEIVAGIDAGDDGHNSYPVYTDIRECDMEADCLIDFSIASAVDGMLDYCVARKLPCVLCTTGLSEQQLQKVKEASGQIPVLRSANMSLGINLLLKLLKDAAGVLAPAGFDMEVVENHHNLKLDAPSGTAMALADSINE
ncbi:MAG: 4-hydroxy-tetrahydrodipicolinate reductase, partial [Acetatifactor sp.]|nr:4-hydroxy-tetrahydrodipicolinate reductase [Acetatifactor sp.]